jgi:hypothetical protein
MAVAPQAFQRAVAEVDWASELATHGPATSLPAFFDSLWNGSALDLEEGWNGVVLDDLWHQGSVFGTAGVKAIEPLLIAAESPECRWRFVAAAALALLANGRGEPEVEQSIWRELARRRDRFERLAEQSGLVGASGRVICQELEKQRNGAQESVLEIATGVENALADCVRKLEAQKEEGRIRLLQRDPFVLKARLEQLCFGTRDDEFVARAVIADAMKIGLYPEALEACQKLTYDAALREELRIQILQKSGAGEEARRALVELAKAWLTPPVSSRDVSQTFLKEHLIQLLKGAHASADAELKELLRKVEVARPEVFIPEGDAF